MKTNLYYILLLSILFAACKKNDILQYGSDIDNISLNYLDPDGGTDTAAVTYSFAETPGLSNDTVWVPVRIAGKRVSVDRKFVLTAVDSLTTAKINLHYEPLKPFYIMPADSGKVLVPVIIKNTDPALATTTVVLGIRVIAGGDFTATLPIGQRSKRIVYSNRLEQPDWWVLWQGNLGPYNRTAHQLFLISGGQDLVDVRKPDAYLQIPRTLYYLENAKNFTRDPFTWVARNPEKEYVLTKRTDGTEDYDFYNINTPNVKIYLKFFPQVNAYFFINENGNQIIMN